MPDWAQTLANFLPFKWTFCFPIEALAGDLSTAQLLGGLGMQALWTAIGGVLVWVCFRRSVRHYTAVGELMRVLRVGWMFFRVGALNELQYRANFFVQLFKSLLSLRGRR